MGLVHMGTSTYGTSQYGD